MSMGIVPVEMISLSHGKMSPFSRMIHIIFRIVVSFLFLIP